MSARLCGPSPSRAKALLIALEYHATAINDVLPLRRALADLEALSAHLQNCWGYTLENIFTLYDGSNDRARIPSRQNIVRSRYTTAYVPKY